MKKAAYALALILILVITAVAAVILLTRLEVNQEEENDLFTYPLSVGDKTYTITVNTNWTSDTVVYLPESGDVNYISFDFVGPLTTTVFFNITVPTDLLWGDISLVKKYYLQDPDRYTLSNNGTHNSIQMTFTHIALVEHFEIRGTEGAW